MQPLTPQVAPCNRQQPAQQQVTAPRPPPQEGAGFRKVSGSREERSAAAVTPHKVTFVVKRSDGKWGLRGLVGRRCLRPAALRQAAADHHAVPELGEWGLGG